MKYGRVGDRQTAFNFLFLPDTRFMFKLHESERYIKPQVVGVLLYPRLAFEKKKSKRINKTFKRLHEDSLIEFQQD